MGLRLLCVHAQWLCYQNTPWQQLGEGSASYRRSGVLKLG